MIVITNSEKETINEGERLGQTLKPGSVVALYGGLGSGKTTFTKGLAKGLGIILGVSSPTFTIVNEYHGPIPLYHFDMYRLAGAEELFDIGWDDYLKSGGVCVVEWSENVEEAIPIDAIIVKFESQGNDIRRIEILNSP